MYQTRNTDVIIGGSDLEDLYCFRDFPLFMGTTVEDLSTDLRGDMNWSISRESGVIQLNPVIDPKVIYQESHGSGAVGKMWADHHREFAEFIKQFNPRNILEIGGGHGLLSKCYFEFPEPPQWTIVEPNPKPAPGVKAKIIQGFFTDATPIPLDLDAVVHSHVFEHVYDPVAFMDTISRASSVGTYLLFSVPNMEEMLSRKYTNCLNFEHTYLLTDDYIRFLTARVGYELVVRKNFRDDHSVFYAFRKTGVRKSLSLATDLYVRHKNLFNEYIRYHLNMVSGLNRLTDAIGPEREVYLFGAHVFSQYLIGFGLNIDRISAVLDNDPGKVGRRLYGTPLKVELPSVLKEKKSPVVILRAGVYDAEIRSQLTTEVNSDVEFI